MTEAAYLAVMELIALLDRTVDPFIISWPVEEMLSILRRAIDDPR